MNKMMIIKSVSVVCILLAAIFGVYWLYEQDETGIREAPELTEITAREQLKGTPLSFQENQGQTDPSVRFVMRGSLQSTFFTPDAIVYSFARPDESQATVDPLRFEEDSSQPRQMLAIRQSFVGARPANVRGEGELRGKVNYFIGNDKEQWRTGIATFAAIRYVGLYDGIEAVYSGRQGYLTYEYVVQPKADPSVLSFSLEGIEGLEVAEDGSLALDTAFDKIGVHRPVAYQTISGQRLPIAVRYEVKDNFTYVFMLGNYNPDYPLIITNAE